MNYATQQDMIDRYGLNELVQLTDHAGANTVNAAVLELALGDAQATVDGYLRTAYQLPLSVVPAELVRVACDLARYYLFGDAAPERVKTRRDEAMAWLRDVSAGRVALGINAATGTAPVAVVSGIRSSAAPRVFNNTTLAGYK